MRPHILKRLLDLKAAKQPVALVTDLSTGQQSLVQAEMVEGESGFWEEDLVEIRTALRTEKSGRIGENLFVQVHLPPPRLVLIGAVHIAQSLAPMAVQLGYGIIIIDPRSAFATEERFPGVTLSTDWPDDAMRALQPDQRTAVVALTHDPKIDDPALEVALASPVFYIGALGSRKTHAKRLERLTAAGFAPAKLDRIHGPVGLAIGAQSQAEIAVSILGQITAVRRGVAS